MEKGEKEWTTQGFMHKKTTSPKSSEWENKRVDFHEFL